MELPRKLVARVRLAAYDAYAKVLKDARAKNTLANLPNDHVDEAEGALEHLKALELDPDQQQKLALQAAAGTPMGDAITAATYVDDDGKTDLQADALLDWLARTARMFPPADVVAAWSLAQRKLVAAWLRALDGNAADGIGSADDVLAAPAQPDFVLLEWYQPPNAAEVTPIAAATNRKWELSDEEVDALLLAGPWAVAAESRHSDLWAVVWNRPVEPDTLPPTHPFVYDLEEARRTAAVMNDAAREEAPAVTDAPALADDETGDAGETGETDGAGERIGRAFTRDVDDSRVSVVEDPTGGRVAAIEYSFSGDDAGDVTDEDRGADLREATAEPAGFAESIDSEEVDESGMDGDPGAIAPEPSGVHVTLD